MTSLNDLIIEDAIAEDDLVAGIEAEVDVLITTPHGAECAATPGSEHVFLKAVGNYTAFAIDLDYMWRWEIYLEDDGLVQHGASLTLASATEAAGHVLAYFTVRDSNKTCGAGDARHA